MYYINIYLKYIKLYIYNMRINRRTFIINLLLLFYFIFLLKVKKWVNKVVNGWIKSEDFK